MNTEYDIYDLPEGHFERFQQRLDKRQKKPSHSWIRYGIVAGLLLLLSVGLLRSFVVQNNVSAMIPELKDIQDFYEGIIQVELANIQKSQMMDQEQKHIVDEALERMEALEQNFDRLKKDFKDYGYSSRLVAAMIKNYQKRIEVLQKLKETLDHQNHKRHENTSV